MVSQAEALELFQSDDLVQIGMRADEVRRRLHPGGVVSYTIERSLDVTDREVLFQKIQETVDRGGTGILIQDDASSGLTIEWYEDLLRDIKKRFEIQCSGFSASEIMRIAEISGLSLHDTVARMHDAGLDSIPSGGVEILDWESVHRTAHSLGMRTTATMMFGGSETKEQLVKHLELVRQIQEETGGFTAFIPWSFQEVTAVEYLKTLAIARIYLENIVNVQASWATVGLKTCQVGLRFGGNDVGSVRIEDRALATEEDLRQAIRDAGFVPKQRDTLYAQYFLN